MTAPPPLALPPHFQPAPKGSSTATSTHPSAALNKAPATSRSPSQARPSRTRQNANSEEFISEKATATLIRRVLGPQTGGEPRSSPRPIENILPPLTSSNEADLQLYAIIAIVVRDFVQVWYTKITPDHVFVEEIVHIIAHCSRAVEQRLRRIDIEEVIFDEIPALIEAHVVAYRAAHEIASRSAYHLAPLRTYHSLNPHPALSPFPDAGDVKSCRLQARNETFYRQLLVQGALAILLPTEDLQNACLRTLVSDIVADLVLGQGISGKACDGWFWHETCIKLVEIVKSRLGTEAKDEEIERESTSRLEGLGLLSSKCGGSPPHLSSKDQSRGSALFWRVLQYTFSFFLLARFAVVGLFRARSLPPRTNSSKWTPASPIAKNASRSIPSPSCAAVPSSASPPILEYHVFSLLSTLLDLSSRMPWLTGLSSLCRRGLLAGSGRLGASDSLLDKFLHNTLTTYVTPWPALLPALLRNLRIALFPFNARAPPARPPPGTDEQLKIRRRAAEALLSLIPRPAARVLFATGTANSTSSVPDAQEKEPGGDGGGDGKDKDEEVEDMIRQIEDILDIFGNAYLNKHLIYNILELVLVRLAPEMGEKTPTELLAERGVVVAASGPSPSPSPGPGPGPG